MFIANTFWVIPWHSLQTLSGSYPGSQNTFWVILWFTKHFLGHTLAFIANTFWVIPWGSWQTLSGSYTGVHCKHFLGHTLGFIVNTFWVIPWRSLQTLSGSYPGVHCKHFLGHTLGFIANTFWVIPWGSLYYVNTFWVIPWGSLQKKNSGSSEKERFLLGVWGRGDEISKYGFSYLAVFKKQNCTMRWKSFTHGNVDLLNVTTHLCLCTRLEDRYEFWWCF